MKEHSNERVVKVVGIDLAKRSFHVYGVDERGQRAAGHPQDVYAGAPA